MNFADFSDRILINSPDSRIVLLDSEFKPLNNFTHPQPDQDDFHIFRQLHYNRERNEVVGFRDIEKTDSEEVLGVPANKNEISVLTIFRFSEE